MDAFHSEVTVIHDEECEEVATPRANKSSDESVASIANTSDPDGHKFAEPTLTDGHDKKVENGPDVAIAKLYKNESFEVDGKIAIVESKFPSRNATRSVKRPLNHKSNTKHQANKLNPGLPQKLTLFKNRLFQTSTLRKHLEKVVLPPQKTPVHNTTHKTKTTIAALPRNEVKRG